MPADPAKFTPHQQAVSQWECEGGAALRHEPSERFSSTPRLVSRHALFGLREPFLMMIERSGRGRGTAKVGDYA
ncbi:MAG: hypothetical protein AAF468_03070 [Pseudomonadota bacterium]